MRMYALKHYHLPCPRACNTHFQICGVKTPLWEVAIQSSHYLWYLNWKKKRKTRTQKLCFFMTPKRQSGCPEETQCQILCSIGMICQCKFASEPENNPCLAAYIGQGSYFPSHFSNPLMNEKRGTSKWSYISHSYQKYISTWDLSSSRAASLTGCSSLQTDAELLDG